MKLNSSSKVSATLKKKRERERVKKKGKRNTKGLR